MGEESILAGLGTLRHTGLDASLTSAHRVCVSRCTHRRLQPKMVPLGSREHQMWGMLGAAGTELWSH